MPVALACLLLLAAGFSVVSLRLYVRHLQEISGEAAVESPGLPAAYGDEMPLPSRFSTSLTYTSLDAPDSGEAVADVEWDDSWFVGDERSYNHELALTSSVLAALAYSESGYYQAGASQPAYMENALSALGFDEVNTSSYRYRSEVLDEVLNLVTDDADAVAYTIARKRLASDSDGASTPRDLILVSVRGSYGSEWLSNLDLSRDDDENHGGYCRAAREVCRELNTWVEESVSRGASVSVLLVGHSRGGAVANLAAAELDAKRAESGQAPIEDGGNGLAALSMIDHAYAYTFATPLTTLNEDAHDDVYSNIFNISNPSDIMPFLPLQSWGYERYGVDKSLPSVDEEGFEEVYAAMRRAYEGSVGVACGADPRDKHVVDGVLSDISSGIGSIEELATPHGAVAVLSSVASRVDPIRILYSHYPSTYIAWLSVVDEADLTDA